MKKDLIEYNDKKEVAKVTTYNDEGGVKSITHFENGVLDGPLITYFDNGKAESESHFTAGKLNGLATYYDDKGALLRTIQFENGLMHGQFTNYNNGKKQVQISYAKGKKNGIMEFYADNGKIKQVMRYENDIQEGETTTFDENTLEIVMSVFYKAGKKHGSSTTYFPNSKGSVFEQSFFEDDALQGYLTRYYQNGKVQQVCQYVKGVQTGKPVNFDKNGNIIEDEADKKEEDSKQKPGFFKKLIAAIVPKAKLPAN